MPRLFKQIDPATRDEALFAAEIARWRDGLALTSTWFSTGPKANQRFLSDQEMKWLR